jgi:hypothetical protein
MADRRSFMVESLSMDPATLSGDLGTWRSGASHCWSLQQVIGGEADSLIAENLGEEVLQDIKLRAAQLLAGSI